MNVEFDIIILGGGPAGLTASIYAGRAGYNTALIEKLATGGQMMLTDTIDNYPGFPDGIKGFDLQTLMLRQAKKFNINEIYDHIIKIEKKDNKFLLYSNEKIYSSLSVIIATGAKHKHLNVIGEKEFTSKGVSYCGTCDAPFFKNKNVIVVGGGDTALTEAIFISKFASNIKIIHRRDRFRAVNNLVETAKKEKKIEFIFNSVVEEIKGNNKVSSVIVKNLIDNKKSEIFCDGVFIFVGLTPNTDFLDENLLDSEKYIITDNNMQTKIEGLFAAGDVRSNAFRQIITACADGAIAAKNSGEYIDKIKGNYYK